MPLEAATRFAPAKINLFLHVGAPQPDGYHPLHSLMVFADVGDRVRLEPAAALAFLLEGAFAEGLRAEADNLVTRARDAFLALAPLAEPFRLVLEKGLPLAAGLGGGSSDAAATLMMLNAAAGDPLSAERLHTLAARLGSDTPACLAAQPVIATGRGDQLTPAPAFADLDAVLVNPRLPCPTGPVYRAYDGLGVFGALEAPSPPAPDRGKPDFVDWLAGCRNDLEAPALTVQPAVATVLAALRAAPETRLARMSGSGATCFSLCESAGRARALAARLMGSHPDWWITPCTLGGTAG